MNPIIAAVLVLTNSTYLVSYESSSRLPVATFHVLSAGDSDPVADRRSVRFVRDARCGPDPSEGWSAAGYDRGHMVPAADRASSPAAMAGTFLMTNVSPQLPGVNRRAWRAVESAVRRLARPALVLTCAVVTNAVPRAAGTAVVPDVLVKVVSSPEGVFAWVVPNDGSPVPDEPAPALLLRSAPGMCYTPAQDGPADSGGAVPGGHGHGNHVEDAAPRIEGRGGR